MPKNKIAATAMALAVASVQAQVVPPVDAPYAPGAISIHVDATDLGQRIFRVKESIPVQPGSLTLLFPKWLPGNHSPRGPIDKIADGTFATKAVGPGENVVRQVKNMANPELTRPSIVFIPHSKGRVEGKS